MPSTIEFLTLDRLKSALSPSSSLLNNAVVSAFSLSPITTGLQIGVAISLFHSITFILSVVTKLDDTG